MADLDTLTDLLAAHRQGDETAEASLLPLLYRELHRLAAISLRRERVNHTLQPTDLVNEVWVRLIDQSRAVEKDPQARERFIGLAAHAMRQVLVDHARRRGAAKRGGDAQRVTLHDDFPGVPGTDSALVLDLEAALTELEQRSAELARVAEMRLFGGLSNQEIAAVRGVSLAKVKIDWNLARAMLTRSLGHGTRIDPACGLEPRSKP